MSPAQLCAHFPPASFPPGPAGGRGGSPRALVSQAPGPPPPTPPLPLAPPSPPPHPDAERCRREVSERPALPEGQDALPRRRSAGPGDKNQGEGRRMPGVELGVGTETEETERRGDRDIEGNQREELIPCPYARPGPTRGSQRPRPSSSSSSLPAPVSPAGSPPCPRSALSQPVSPDSGSRRVPKEGQDKGGPPAPASARRRAARIKGRWEDSSDGPPACQPHSPPGIAGKGTSICPPRRVHALTSEPDGKATARASLAHFTGR